MIKFVIHAIVLISFTWLLQSCSKGSNQNGSSTSQGTSVYLSGMEIVGQNFVATYWKDAVKFQLSNNYSYANDIFVSGTDVYVVGFEGLNVHYPVMWKNGVKTQLSSSPGEANSIYISGSDVYVCGTENLGTTNSGQTVAFLWKNGAKSRYGSNSGANSVFVNGLDVFIAGYSQYGNGFIATYWHNGVIPTSLIPNSGTASDIFVTNTELYMVGKDFTNSLASIWRRSFGGASNMHTKTPLTTKASGEARSVSASGSDLYIAGVEDGACYWKNGVRIQLNNDSQSSANKVFTTGKDFYIAGRGGTNLSAGYWKNGTWVNVSSTSGTHATSIFVK